MEKLYAGPWAGEFGWEICSWTPCLRHIAQAYNEVVIETVPGSEYLYEFADRIITNPREPDFDMYTGTPKKPQYDPGEGFEILTPKHFWHKHARKEFRAIRVAGKAKDVPPKKWRKLGTEEQEFVADVMCAFRGPKRFRGRSYPEKQWSEERCIALSNMFLEAGYSVACYGGEDNLYVEGTIDFRGVPLDKLCGALSRARVAVGPSSGTIHLASSCGTPHVTWYGRPVVSMERYMSYWNPFDTPVIFVDVPQPSVGLVFESCNSRMDPKTETKKWVKK